MTLAEDVLPHIIPYIGGAAGISLVYAVTMVWLAILRHRSEARLEARQERMARQVRDLWLDWLRRRER